MWRSEFFMSKAFVGGKEAVLHLLELGHRRIGFIFGPDSTLRERELVFSDNSCYGRLLTLGIEDGRPIVAFTTARTDLHANTRRPTHDYVKTITSGIKEAYPEMSNADIFAYFLRADGLRGSVDPTELKRWIIEA
jgi:hypothetical protein